MAASDTSTDLATALTAYAGACALLFTTDTSGYGTIETAATDAKADVLSALSTFNSAAGILAAVTVTWRGTSQSAVELAAKIYEMVNSVGCLNDVDASDAATAFASAALSYLGTGH